MSKSLGPVPHARQALELELEKDTVGVVVFTVDSGAAAPEAAGHHAKAPAAALVLQTAQRFQGSIVVFVEREVPPPDGAPVRPERPGEGQVGLLDGLGWIDVRERAGIPR